MNHSHHFSIRKESLTTHTLAMNKRSTDSSIDHHTEDMLGSACFLSQGLLGQEFCSEMHSRATPNTYFSPYLQAVTFLQKDSLSCPKLNHNFANDVHLFFSFIF